MPKRKNNILITEKPFPYDWKEYQIWINEDDVLREAKINSLLKLSGCLGKNRSTFINQAKKGKGSQHFPEIKYAGHLVKNEGFKKKYLTHEKFTFSLSEVERLSEIGFDPRTFFKDSLIDNLSEDFMRARGTYKLQEVFNDFFWKKFEQLYNKNIDILTKSLGTINVDLCAINHDKQIIKFIELKKYNLGRSKTEGVTTDQLFVLGSVTHIYNKFKEKIFRENHYEVIAELIAFVPKQDKQLLEKITIDPPKHLVPCQF